jgi:hypothetical protein
MSALATLAVQRTALDALAQITAAFGHLPVACFSVGDVFPDQLCIDVHDDLDHFETWRTALGIPADTVDYSTTTLSMALKAYGSFGGAEVRLIGFAPLLPAPVAEAAPGGAA